MKKKDWKVFVFIFLLLYSHVTNKMKMRRLTDNEANTQSGRLKINVESLSDLRHTYWSNNENHLGQLAQLTFQQGRGVCGLPVNRDHRKFSWMTGAVPWITHEYIRQVIFLPFKWLPKGCSRKVFKLSMMEEFGITLKLRTTIIRRDIFGKGLG